MREVCAKHILERLPELRQSGHLAGLVKQHRGELHRGIVAFLRGQLQAARPGPLRGSQAPSSTCGDSPCSARSVASSRPGKAFPCQARDCSMLAAECSSPSQPSGIFGSTMQAETLMRVTKA